MLRVEGRGGRLAGALPQLLLEDRLDDLLAVHRLAGGLHDLDRGVHQAQAFLFALGRALLRHVAPGRGLGSLWAWWPSSFAPLAAWGAFVSGALARPSRWTVRRAASATVIVLPPAVRTVILPFSSTRVTVTCDRVLPDRQRVRLAHLHVLQLHSTSSQIACVASLPSSRPAHCRPPSPPTARVGGKAVVLCADVEQNLAVAMPAVLVEVSQRRRHVHAHRLQNLHGERSAGSACAVPRGRLRRGTLLEVAAFRPGQAARRIPSSAGAAAS